MKESHHDVFLLDGHNNYHKTMTGFALLTHMPLSLSDKSLLLILDFLLLFEM